MGVMRPDTRCQDNNLIATEQTLVAAHQPSDEPVQVWRNSKCRGNCANHSHGSGCRNLGSGRKHTVTKTGCKINLLAIASASPSKGILHKLSSAVVMSSASEQLLYKLSPYPVPALNGLNL